MDWLRIAIIVSCSTGTTGIMLTDAVRDTVYHPQSNCTQRAVLTLHASREDAIKAEIDQRQNGPWDYSEPTSLFSANVGTRGVYLVHGKTVEQLTFKPKTKTVTKTVTEQVPDGETPETTPIPEALAGSPITSGGTTVAANGSWPSPSGTSKFLVVNPVNAPTWQPIAAPPLPRLPLAKSNQCLYASDVDKGVYEWKDCPSIKAHGYTGDGSRDTSSLGTPVGSPGDLPLVSSPPVVTSEVTK